MELKSIRESFLPAMLQRNFGRAIFESLEGNQHTKVKGAAGSAPSLFAAELFLALRQDILFVLDDKEDAHYATAELEELLGEKSVLYFPETNREPYHIEKTQNANIVLRTEVLNRITNDNNPRIIVANAAALSEKVLKKEDFKAISHTIKTGDQLDFDFTEELLTQFDFEMTDFVSQPGEFSVRGGIVDVFSYSNEKPYRISFFGNEVESIREFDIETQLSTRNIDSFELISNMNFAVTGSKVSLLEILQKETLIITKNIFLIQKKLQQIFGKAEENFAKLSVAIQHEKPQGLFVSSDDFTKNFSQFKTIDFTSESLEANADNQLISSSLIQLSQSPMPVFNKNFEMLAEDLIQKKKDGYEVWIAYSNEKQQERLDAILKAEREKVEVEFEASGNVDEWKSWREIKSEDFHEGFIDSEEKIAVYTDHQIFGRYQRFKAKNSFAKSEQLTLKDLMSLKVGDYIAHIDHGIGKFMGLVKLNNDGRVQESFKLVYKNGDLLYVSIHSLHKISKYNAPEGKEVALSKLGSPAWKSLKQKTKNKVKEIAFDLIKLYAKRKTAKGFAFSPDTYLQDELEASFIYEDTPDQEKATHDVKRDMEAETVMDRLVCGDVGFGKTEVAIRAAFKAATDGKQVAVLVPTTILAFQHYRSFSERLAEFPVTIAYLNRFRTAKQRTQIMKDLEEGKLDIIIGTHQLVSDKVKFKDLGLLIIDEEHKFGVAVKDKLKTLKADVDTLTLTATPIPRTLQFSLMAARDLSVIKTPPPNRQPVETQVIGFDEETIRDAVSYEIQRGGQVYFINNRIENLQEIAGLIQRLVPDARIITGHGQMEGKKLEQNVLDFMAGNYDVLVSTTIVESGVDVPNANTIFINDAQKFGMADLHQMRGRVGRSNRKAFCYLITPPYDLISTEARKRLEAVEQFSDLGSGFQIAMKDLEIRGAGDLLGGEQSGFINEMGFETYQKIMQEALEELQYDEEFQGVFDNEQERKKLFRSVKDVNIDTDFELMLPSDFVQSTEERLLLYQKLAEITDKFTLSRFENELMDRFGKLPEEAQNLLKSVELKWLAAEIGFEKVVMKNGVFLGYFPENPQDKYYQSEKFQKILRHITQNPEGITIKEKNNQLLLRKESVRSLQQIMPVMEKLVEKLSDEG
ncbi:transcription-repair coupling factor [Cruoricaptor ignavus]|uniref:transcription-repair coupling factor n=1 Tax=Cruoricaptor ignavus TaxID=1118202 RepID=UPI00370DBC9C